MDRPALRITSIPYERIKRSRGTLSPHAPSVPNVGIFCAYILRITKSLSLSKVLHFIIEPTIYKSGDFDLLITDLNIPGMDGIELIRRVRKINPEQRIIVVTGFPSHESQEEAFKLGALSYIVKPFALDRFLELVAKAISGNGEEGLVGLVELRCEDLIPTFIVQGKSVILEILKGDKRGLIFFEKGKLVHAKTQDHFGKEAFYEIKSWKSSRFYLRPLDAPVIHSINSTALPFYRSKEVE